LTAAETRGALVDGVADAAAVVLPVEEVEEAGLEAITGIIRLVPAASYSREP
jgi:hypothetical protein